MALISSSPGSLRLQLRGSGGFAPPSRYLAVVIGGRTGRPVLRMLKKFKPVETQPSAGKAALILNFYVRPEGHTLQKMAYPFEKAYLRG